MGGRTGLRIAKGAPSWKICTTSRILTGKEHVVGRQDIIERIRAQAEAVRALGATALYIYGSRARGDERPDSDLDVFVDFDPERFGFVELVELEDMLARELGMPVQLGTHDALHPLIRPEIEREAVRVL
jgi:predicted nucleotidyltransferase